MSNFYNGFIKRAEELGIAPKTAEGMFNSLPSPVQLQQQQYMGQNPRREFTPGEEAKISSREGSMLPKIFQSLADSPAEKIYSPLTDTAVGGGAGALLGGLVGRAVGGEGSAGGLIGAGAGGLLAGLAANLRRKAKNNDMKEQMRFLPENATQRHYYADPLVQKSQDRSHEQAIAKMMSQR